MRPGFLAVWAGHPHDHCGGNPRRLGPDSVQRRDGGKAGGLRQSVSRNYGEMIFLEEFRGCALTQRSSPGNTVLHMLSCEVTVQPHKHVEHQRNSTERIDGILVNGCFDERELCNIKSIQHYSSSSRQGHSREVTDHGKHMKKRQNANLGVSMVQREKLDCRKRIMNDVPMAQENSFRLAGCA